MEYCPVCGKPVSSSKDEFCSKKCRQDSLDYHFFALGLEDNMPEKTIAAYQPPNDLSAAQSTLREIARLLEESGMEHNFALGDERARDLIEDVLLHGVPAYRCAHEDCREPLRDWSACRQVDEREQGGGAAGYYCPECGESIDMSDDPRGGDGEED